MADAIKLSSELVLLKQLVETEGLSKEILQTRYKKLHISSQLEVMPVALLFYLRTVYGTKNKKYAHYSAVQLSGCSWSAWFAQHRTNGGPVYTGSFNAPLKASNFIPSIPKRAQILRL
jgi:hypothetical protein